MKSWDRVRIIHDAWLDNTGQTQNYFYSEFKECVRVIFTTVKIKSYQSLSPFYVSEYFTNLNICFLKLSIQTTYFCFLYTKTDQMAHAQACHESIEKWGFILRACVQVQCSNHEMTHDLNTVLCPLDTAKRPQPIAESNKNPGWDFLFYSLQSQEHLSNQGLAINKCNIWMLQQF